METLTVEEAAAFLKMHPDTLSAQAKAGEVPAAKMGKRWVFVKADLIEHIRSKYKTEDISSTKALKELIPAILKIT